MKESSGNSQEVLFPTVRPAKGAHQKPAWGSACSPRSLWFQAQPISRDSIYSKSEKTAPELWCSKLVNHARCWHPIWVWVWVLVVSLPIKLSGDAPGRAKRDGASAWAPAPEW